jgi:hypothetical protein
MASVHPTGHLTSPHPHISGQAKEGDPEGAVHIHKPSLVPSCPLLACFVGSPQDIASSQQNSWKHKCVFPGLHTEEQPLPNPHFAQDIVQSSRSAAPWCPRKAVTSHCGVAGFRINTASMTSEMLQSRVRFGVRAGSWPVQLA